MRTGILGAIEVLGELNEGKPDIETHKLVRKIINAMKTKQRQEWPSKELRKIVNSLDKIQYNIFLEVLTDMDNALTEAYGDLI